MTMDGGSGDFDGIEIETAANPRFSIIWLHGLGADGNDFVPIVPELRLPAPTRFVFPNAPVRPVTINGGYRMRAWYDILSFDRRAGEDAAGIEASAAQLRDLVAREGARGVATTRIVLAGFSQGGAIVLHTALTGEETFAGVLALSTYLPLARSTLAAGQHVNTTTPVWMAHGIHDPVIDLGTGERSRDALAGAGVPVEWHTYPMPHSVCPEEIRDIAAWLSGLQARRAGAPVPPG